MRRIAVIHCLSLLSLSCVAGGGSRISQKRTIGSPVDAGRGGGTRVSDDEWRWQEPRAVRVPSPLRPQIRKVELQNGLQIYVIERHILPSVVIEILIKQTEAGNSKL